MELGEVAEPEDLGKAKSHCKPIVSHTTRNALGQGEFRSQRIKELIERGTCNERSTFDLLRTLESRDDCRSHATISEMRINDLVVHVKGEEERGIDDGDIILSSTGLIEGQDGFAGLLFGKSRSGEELVFAGRQSGGS